MRACAAILIFSAWPCFIQTLNTRTNRETSSNFADTSDNVIHQISTCVNKLGLTKCIGAYGNWRAEEALDNEVRPLKDYRETFPWQLYRNISNEELQAKLCDSTLKLLEQRSLKLSLSQSYDLALGGKGNGSLSVDILKCDDEFVGRGSMKKLRKHFYNMMPFLLIPGLIMSAVLPFFLPSLKMMTLVAGMLNNMALTGAVFTLLRNNAFNDKYEKKIIYINDGYYNDKYEPLADTPSQVIVDGNFDNNYNGFDNHDFKQFNFIEKQPIDNDYQLNSEWLKGLTGGKVRNVKIIPEKFNTNNDWRKQDDIDKTVEVPKENKIN
nr:uncharacterized protein LOC113395464 [Vanessa tameamea]